MKGNAGAKINSDDVPEGMASDSSNDSADTPSSDSKGSAVKIDLHAGTKRTMLVQFTCDRCGAPRPVWLEWCHLAQAISV